MKKGKLSELKCGNNFSYIINDNSIFLATDYKVLQNQNEGCFIKSMKLLLNGKIQFYYMTNEYKSFSQMLPMLDVNGFMNVVSNIFFSVLTVKQNGFLTCENIDIAFDKVFVEPKTYKVAFIYLPVKEHLYQNQVEFENVLRSNLVKVLSESENLISQKTECLQKYLNNGMLSVDGLYEKIMKINTVQDSCLKEQSKNNNEIFENFKLVALNEAKHFEINITKDNFVIGKNSSVADGVISYNNTISRVHCRITKEDGQYYITDMNSKNGTYVNGTKLPPEHLHKINKGDIIRLSNSNFQVVIS